jgi:thioredoxin-like negative regulator of GroEL
MQFDEFGGHRNVINIVEHSIPLALKRGALWVARLQLEIAQRHLSGLRQDLGASVQLAALAQNINTAGALLTHTLPAPVDELVNWIEQRPEELRNPEQEAQWLLQAIEQCPDDQNLRGFTAQILYTCSAIEEAIKLLWKYIEKYPRQVSSIAYYLIDLLLMQDQPERVQSLGKLFRDNGVLQMALWCELKYAEVQQHPWTEIEKLCRELLKVQPEFSYVYHLLVNALFKQKRYAEAARELEAKCNKNDTPGDFSFLYKHVSFATIAQDWEGVRRSCKKLGIPVNTKKGPINENWGPVRIRFDTEGEGVFYEGLRTGPATARITELSPGEPQRLNDLIVFNPELLNVEPDDDEEDNDIPTFLDMGTIEEGNVGPGWFVYGAFPGKKQFKNFTDLVHKRGWFIHPSGDNEFSLINPKNGQRNLPGFCFLIAAPKNQSPKELNDFLVSASKQWEHPCVWPNLATRCDLPAETLQLHFDLMERYGITEVPDQFPE